MKAASHPTDSITILVQEVKIGNATAQTHFFVSFLLSAPCQNRVAAICLFAYIVTEHRLLARSVY